MKFFSCAKRLFSIDVSASLGYGYVFSRELVFSAMKEYKPKYEGQSFEQLEKECCFSEALSCVIGGHISDSVDCYSGEDDSKEVYIVTSPNTELGCRGGDCQVYEKDHFKINLKELKAIDAKLKDFGLYGKQKKTGWIFRTFLS